MVKSVCALPEKERREGKGVDQKERPKDRFPARSGCWSSLRHPGGIDALLHPPGSESASQECVVQRQEEPKTSATGESEEERCGSEGWHQLS